jgi:predicted adenylyl cyclase CyaB
MLEVEVKVLEMDRSAFEKAIHALGAKKIFDGELDYSIFDTPERALYKKGDVLRLRTEHGKTIMTYKRKVSTKGAKQMEESSVIVHNPEDARGAIMLSGLEEVAHWKKHRTSYKLGEYRFDFDKIAGIPEYLEIEAKNKRELQKMLVTLKIKKSKVKTWNEFEVREYYGKRSVTDKLALAKMQKMNNKLRSGKKKALALADVQKGFKIRLDS